jgi:voltage-gated potassium channel
VSAGRRTWLAPAALTAVLVGLVIAAADEPGDRVFTLVLVAALGGAVAFLQTVFPGSRFFVLALANGLAVYTSLFIVFLRSNFPTASPGAIRVGFALPILAFLAGAWWRRERIRAIVAETRVGDRGAIARGALWLLPVFAIGVLTFAAPNVTAAGADAVFLLAMAAIAVIVVAVSADVATFLVEAGLLFDEFFDRVRALAAPAFAFMTFYSIIVIAFASVYRLMDRFEPAASFAVGGAPRALTFPESLYFSIVTMATVGYGDIVPASDAARMVAALQVVLGVLLLLFGFSELMAHARERRGRPEA